MVIEDHEALRARLARTPSARAILRDAYQIMRHPDGTALLDRAWAFHVIAMQTMAGNYSHGSWRPTFRDQQRDVDRQAGQSRLERVSPPAWLTWSSNAATPWI